MARRARADLTGKERMDRARAKIAKRLDPELGKVVADPLRVQIVAMALADEISAPEFADEWDIPRYGANYHMRFLRRRDFLVVVDEVQRRGATEIFYRATKRVFISDANWAPLAGLIKGNVSKAVVEDLYRAILQAGEANTLDARDESILWWQEVPLDEITFPKAMKMQRLLIERLVSLGDETLKNQSEGRGGRSFPGVFALMGFEGAPEKKPFRRRPRRDPDSRKRRKKGKGGGK